MGLCCSQPKDPQAPKATPSSYPRNPAYANRFNDQNPAPLVVPSAGNYNEGGGEGILVVAAMSGHTSIQPSVYNPMSGDYGW